ncbi:MAG: L,D-transpeptidase [Pseudomonadota bacterium]
MEIEISLAEQRLVLSDDQGSIKRWAVSTALNGAGEKQDSECTPRGTHIVDEMIGDGEPINTVFVGRRPTGEIYSPELARNAPERDWILTRILWLRGLEAGFNSGPGCDSKERYIYIHGTPDAVVLGKPGSRGCVRMANSAIIELFQLVSVGTLVNIKDAK